MRFLRQPVLRAITWLLLGEVLAVVAISGGIFWLAYRSQATDTVRSLSVLGMDLATASPSSESSVDVSTNGNYIAIVSWLGAVAVAGIIEFLYRRRRPSSPS